MAIGALIIGIALLFVGFVLAPQVKAAKPTEMSEMDNPTADAGKPIGVIFGEILNKGPNFLWFGDKYYLKRTAKTKKK